MNREFQLYRFARIEAQNITRARLEAQFKDGITNLDAFDKAIEQQLTTEPSCTPWRTSEIEQTGCREGMQIAALEFYWVHRQILRGESLYISAQQRTKAVNATFASSESAQCKSKTS